MIGFSATYSALIDDKGRVVLPAPLKKAMGELADEPLVIEKDIYKPCLNIYPEKRYSEKLDKVANKLNEFNETDDDLLDELYENFTTLSMAPNGRINIPSDFMEHAGITREVREVMFAGKGAYIRLWNEKIYGEVKKVRKSLRDMYRERLGNNPEDDRP